MPSYFWGHLLNVPKIVGTDYSNLSFNGGPATPESATFKLTEHCTYLPSEGLDIEEFVTDDTKKIVWVIKIPKHQSRKPVIVYKKAWQRIKDSLVQMTSERMAAILSEPMAGNDWSAEVIPEARLSDLDPKAISLAREKFKELNSHRAKEVDDWDDIKPSGKFSAVGTLEESYFGKKVTQQLIINDFNFT